ncbi:MAG: hypothetical protein AABW52_02795 [Nanoarchaeota archaeon]
MQEKFALKKTLRKVAAVGTSIAMVGVTLSGALAVGTLGNYPSPFTKNVGETVVVWGADTDSAAVQDVLAGLPGTGTTSGTTQPVVPGKVLYGVNSLGTQKTDDLFQKGDTEDMALGTLLNVSTEFGSTLQDNQVGGLLDSSINIDIGSVSDDYTMHEEVFFNGAATNGSSVESGLTFDRSEEWKERVFLQIPTNSLGYRFKFDKVLKSGNFLNDSSSADPIVLPFLGKTLEITSATNTSITAIVGTQQRLSAGDSVVVNVAGVQRTVTLKGTSASKADVEVDGQPLTITEDSTRTFRFSTGTNVQVRVQDVFNEDGVANDRATLIVGEDARKTYNSGDEYIGEDEDDPIWTWNLVGLRTNNPTLEVKNALSVDNWDETENPAVKHALYVGDYLCLPNNYVCLVFDGTSEADESFQQYEIRSDVSRALSNEDTDAAKREGARTISFKAVGVSDQGFRAGGSDTDEVVMAINESQITLSRKEQDGSEFIQFANTTVTWGAFEGLYNSTLNDAFTLDFKSSSIPVDIHYSNSTSKGNITLDFGTADSTTAAGGYGDTDGNVILRFENDTATTFTYLGDSDSDTTTANDVRYNDMGTYYDISGKEENLRTSSGVVLYDPKASQSADTLKFALPGDATDYKALVRVAQPKEGTTGSGVVVKSASVTMRDTDVADLTAYNVVAVGGPCVNKATRQLLNMAADSPACGTDSGLTGAGDAVVELKANGAKSALLVWGWEADDTRRAAVLLKNPDTFKQKLTEAGKTDQTSVTVKGTDLSLSGITVA